MGRIVTQDKLNEMTGQSIDYGKGGGYCPYYDLLISRWGNVVKQPNNYRSDQLVKEEDIVVNKDLFLINTEAGNLYFAGGGTYAQIPAIDGNQDFVYIAGEGEAVGALSILGGLYVLNSSTKQWELKYKDTARRYSYTHLARFSTGWVFYKAVEGDDKSYIIIVYDNGTTKELSVVGSVCGISTGPFDFCCVGSLYHGGARVYTFSVGSVPNSLTYYTLGMFFPNAVIQGDYGGLRGLRGPRGVVYGTTSNYTYFSNNPQETQWTAATTRPQLTSLTKGLHAYNEFVLVGGNMKSVSKDGGDNWITSTLGEYTLTDLIYINSNYYAIGMNGTKRFLLHNTASTFDQSNKMLDLPDYSIQVIKINV